jgi:hypothetical protein
MYIVHLSSCIVYFLIKLSPLFTDLNYSHHMAVEIPSSLLAGRHLSSLRLMSGEYFCSLSDYHTSCAVDLVSASNKLGQHITLFRLCYYQDKTVL